MPIPPQLIWLIVDRALDAIAVGVERTAVRAAIDSATTPDDIPAAIRKLRIDAVAAAQAEIDKPDA